MRALVAQTAPSDVTIFGSRAGLHRSAAIPTMDGPHSIAMADLDRDGRAELLVITEERDQLLIVQGR